MYYLAEHRVRSEGISPSNEQAKVQLEERERLLEEGREELVAAAVELGKERNALAVSVSAFLSLISKLTRDVGGKT